MDQYSVIVLKYLDQISGESERGAKHEALEKEIWKIESQNLSEAFQKYEAVLYKDEINKLSYIYEKGLLDGIKLMMKALK